MKDYGEILSGYASEGRLRRLSTHDVMPEVIDLSTNDYLGMAADPAFSDEFLRESAEWRFSSAASRLLASVQSPYASLEAYLSELYGKSALLFNSGYHANTGTVSALSIPGTIMLCDKLVHASIIDGLTLSRNPYYRFRHNDVASLRKLLEKHHDDFDRVIVVVESVYSMDGDIAPLSEIVALKRDFPSMLLYVDEAHALGVRGERGLGVAEELGLLNDVDILIGTFGKALASSGAFVVTTPVIREFLLNSARSFIFSTALPPINVAFTHFMMRKMVAMHSSRQYLRHISRRFIDGIASIAGQQPRSDSQIVPLMAGSNARAVGWSVELRRQGVLALPIRRPTVAAGTERIRFSLNASLTDSEIDKVLNLIEGLR